MFRQNNGEQLFMLPCQTTNNECFFLTEIFFLPLIVYQFVQSMFACWLLYRGSYTF